MIKDKIYSLIGFLVSFFSTLAVYYYTLCPTIYLEDSSEFVTISHSLGIAHPPGYPLYALVGKVFSFIPIGSVAFRVNFMSAFFAALTVGFLFLIIRRIVLGINKKDGLFLSLFVPIIGSLIFAFTRTFWSQAVVAEVYTLNSFFVSVIIYLLLVWQQKVGKSKSDNVDSLLLVVAFVFGLAVVNHQMMVLLLPAFGLFILLVKSKVILDYKLILAALFLVVLGLSLFLYLPIRAEQNTAFNWGNPQTFAGFKSHILRKQYDDFSISGIGFDKDKMPLVEGYFSESLDQFTWIGILFVLFGFISMFFEKKKIFWLSFLVFLGNGLLILFLREGPYTILNELVARVYYLPAYLIMSIWLTLGLNVLIKRFLLVLDKFSDVVKKLLIIAVCLLLFLLPISYAINNYSLSNRADFYFADDWARSTLESMKENAYLVIYNDQPALDSMIFSLAYMQIVENVRPDIKLVNLTGVRGKLFFALDFVKSDFVSWPEDKKRYELASYVFELAKNEGSPAYTLYPLSGNPRNLVTKSNGWVYKVYEGWDDFKKDEWEDKRVVLPRSLEYGPLEGDLFYNDLRSDYYYALATYYVYKDMDDLVGLYLIKAIEGDVSPFSFNYQAFVDHRNEYNKEVNK